MNEIEHICVDKDILNFLKVIYFGDINDPIKKIRYAVLGRPGNEEPHGYFVFFRCPQ